MSWTRHDGVIYSVYVIVSAAVAEAAVSSFIFKTLVLLGAWSFSLVQFLSGGFLLLPTEIFRDGFQLTESERVVMSLIPTHQAVCFSFFFFTRTRLDLDAVEAAVTVLVVFANFPSVLQVSDPLRLLNMLSASS